MILSKPNHIKIYGHRGARGNLPENTLESFSFLFENEINAFETDILISKDLIHWENKPIAIYPDGNNYIFSGSAIVDNENKSGLGNGENPPILAFYTNHDMFLERMWNETKEDRYIHVETQHIAYSQDLGCLLYTSDAADE